VCHDAVGSGLCKIVERGYTRPPSYHIERLRQAPVGHFFRVVTRGYGSMPSYAAQIPPRDRWSIVAYVRALQLSQHFPVDKLPEDMQDEWTRAEKMAGSLLKNGTGSETLSVDAEKSIVREVPVPIFQRAASAGGPSP
jgi:hypothetical protein